MKIFMRKLLRNILLSYVALILIIYFKYGNFIKLTEVEVHLVFLGAICIGTYSRYLASSNQKEKS